MCGCTSSTTSLVSWRWCLSSCASRARRSRSCCATSSCAVRTTTGGGGHTSPADQQQCTCLRTAHSTSGANWTSASLCLYCCTSSTCLSSATASSVCKCGAAGAGICVGVGHTAVGQARSQRAGSTASWHQQPGSLAPQCMAGLGCRVGVGGCVQKHRLMHILGFVCFAGAVPLVSLHPTGLSPRSTVSAGVAHDWGIECCCFVFVTVAVPDDAGMYSACSHTPLVIAIF